MWPHRAIRDEPSEQGSTFVWKEIRIQNELNERIRNAPRKPKILIAPEGWFMVLAFGAIYAGIATGVITNSIFRLLLA